LFLIDLLLNYLIRNIGDIMKKKKVLFVVDEKQMGGVSVLLSDIMKKINLKKYNIDIMVLHNNGEYLDDLPKSINLIYGTSFFKTIDYTLKEVLKSKNIKNIINKLYLIFLMKTGLIGKKINKERSKCINTKYDVEIAFKDGFCALFTAYGDSIKKYHWLHTDYSMYDCTANYKKLFDKVFPMFDKIIGISNSVLERFMEKYNVKKTDVIFNIINEEEIKSKSIKEDIKYNEKINLVSVGRIHNMKGYDRLIHVMNKLNKENLLDNVALRIIGDGPDFNLIKRLVIEYNLENKILLMGRMRNPFPYVKSSDAFLMCSRYEPFGLVVLESMILGVPVISTEVASINEIMDEKYGMIVENSEEGLYQGIKKIIDDKTILNKYKNNLKDYLYPTDKIINDIEKLMED